MTTTTTTLFPLACIALLSIPACSDSSAAELGQVADADLTASQAELLDLAFAAVSAMPLDPHVKNRSRAQSAVVAACFELDQPGRALRDIEQIANWRRGVGYGDYAIYCLEHGDRSEADHYLDQAVQIADELVNSGGSQAWRVARIRARVASAYLAMEREQEAAELEGKLVASEAGGLATRRALLADAANFDNQLAQCDSAFAAGDLDQVRNALATCVALYDRFYDDRERRSQLEQRIKSAYDKLPPLIRLDLLLLAASHAVEHGDAANALALAGDVESLMSGLRWLPEQEIPLVARLAVLRFRAGAETAARAQLLSALEKYDAGIDQIINIYRADVLRAVAEAFQSMGDLDGALRVYKRAVAAGVENPNSRPRAEDVAATCCSLAVHGVEPDGELRGRLSEIVGQLGDPW